MEDGCVVWFEDIESVITYTVYRNNRKKKKKKIIGKCIRNYCTCLKEESSSGIFWFGFI